MISLHLPTLDKVKAFLTTQAVLPYSYQNVQHTQHPEKVANFDNDQIKVKIGEGDADFDLAKIAIQNWQMFPARWTLILPVNAPIQENISVAMYAHFLGVWWRNACRIVYVIDEPTQFGFAYGTLPGHVEAGEELFLVSKDNNGSVWYELKAFSRPRHWLAKLAYPIMRRLQARFRRDSAQAMKDSMAHF